MIIQQFEGQIAIDVTASPGGARLLRIRDAQVGIGFEVALDAGTAEQLAEKLRSPSIPLASVLLSDLRNGRP